MATGYFYYCSDLDVQDELLNLDFGSNSTMTEAARISAIGKSYGEINAAAAKGGYTVPVENTVRQDVTGALAAATSQVAITVSDGTKYSVGQTLRVHGESGNNHKDEFIPIALIATDVLTVPVLRNSYDDAPDPTAELCLEGFLYLRDCNAKGGAVKLFRGLGMRTANPNAKLTSLTEEYNQCLTDLAEGTINLEGLPLGNAVAISFQTENPDDPSVDPVVTRERIW